MGALFGRSLSMHDESLGACSNQISKPLSVRVDGGSDGRPDRQMARAHRLSSDPNRTRVIRPYGECHLEQE